MRMFLTCITAAAVMLPVSTALAQYNTTDMPLFENQLYGDDSGLRANPTDHAQVVYQEIVRIPDGTSLRLFFGAGTEVEKGGYIRVSSVLDGDAMELDMGVLEEWSFSTAYFNGDTLYVELIAAPHTFHNRLVIDEVAYQPMSEIQKMIEQRGGGGQCGICGSDDRFQTSEEWTARLFPAGCTASVYTTDSCMVTAGHCIDDTGSSDVVQFNVPNSLSNCATQNPPAADQFPIVAKQFLNAGVGADWGAMLAGSNSSGQHPYERYGVLRPIAASPASVGAASDVWGYGVDLTCFRSQTQQLSDPGSISFRGSNHYEYGNDIRGGNSGSALMVNDEIVGIVTHCSTGGCPNFGSRIDIPAFVNAREAVCNGGGGGAPENDVCADAIPVFDGNTSYSTIQANTDGPTHGGCQFDGQTYHDIWYTYVATCTGTLTVSTCDDIHNQGDPSYDTDLVIYGPYGSAGDINCNSLSLLDCNDDDPDNPCGGAPTYSSTIQVEVTAGNTYLVRVGGWDDGDQGTGTLHIDCDGVSVGACCIDGACFDSMTPGDCGAAGGSYQGDGTACASVECPAVFAGCCLPDGNCVDVTMELCDDLGGTWNLGQDCADLTCEQPTGACCFSDGSCAELEEDICIGAGGEYNGDGSDCGSVSCPQPEGACCFGDGSCTVTDAGDCDASGGLYMGDDTDCGSVSCPQPDGACCYGDGTCDVTTVGDCTAGGGTYQGDGTECASAKCPEDCPEDIDNNGSVGTTDLLAMLSAWGPCPGGCDEDVNDDEDVNIEDLLQLLAAWGPCP